MIKKAEIEMTPGGEKYTIDFVQGLHEFHGVALAPAVEATGLVFRLKETHHDWYGMRFDVIKVYGCLVSREFSLFQLIHLEKPP